MKKLLIPVLLGLAFQSSAVFASSNSSSAEAMFDWSAITFNLIDLTPSDGLSPSVTWSWQYGGTRAGSSSYESGRSSSVDVSYDAPSASSVVSSNATSFFATGKSVYDNQKLAISSIAEVPDVASYGSGYANAFAWQYASFSLNGAGVMVITVPYTIKVSGDLNNYSDYARAAVNIYGNYSSTDGSSTSVHANKSFESVWSGDKDYSGAFTFSVANASDAFNTSGYFDVSLSTLASAYTNVPSVPEPETYAMMLAGLSLIASRFRRYNTKSA